MRGRVMSLITVTMQGFSPLGALLIGALAALISIQSAVAISAAFCGLLAVIALGVAPVVRDYESPEAQEEPGRPPHAEVTAPRPQPR
jgi:hypothetical protein